MDKIKLKKLIDEFEDTCQNKDGYCFAREFMAHMCSEPRNLIQIKLIEKIKFDRSKELKQDIGWDGAFKFWIETGYAKKFDKLYDEEKSLNQLYKEIKNGDG